MSNRVRKGVSLGHATVATLEAMVAAGTARNLSDAIDVAVADVRRRQLDADLIAAASGPGVAAEADMPGVIGGRDASGPTWESLAP